MELGVCGWTLLPDKLYSAGCDCHSTGTISCALRCTAAFPALLLVCILLKPRSLERFLFMELYKLSFGSALGFIFLLRLEFEYAQEPRGAAFQCYKILLNIWSVTPYLWAGKASCLLLSCSWKEPGLLALHKLWQVQFKAFRAPVCKDSHHRSLAVMCGSPGFVMRVLSTSVLQRKAACQKLCLNLQSKTPTEMIYSFHYGTRYVLHFPFYI